MSPDILELGKIHAQCSIGITFNLQGLSGVNRAYFEELTIKLPKGLTTSVKGYDPSTGLLKINELEGANGVAKLEIPITEINCPQAGVNLKNGSVDFLGDLEIVSGTACIYKEDVSSFTAPESLTLRNDYQMSAMQVNEFSGKVAYKLANLNVSDINLSDLPDFLNKPGTDLRLTNPQLYLSVTNPLSANKLQARTGITITQIRDNQPSSSFTLDNGNFTIGSQEVNNILLSPTRPDKFYPGFDNSEWNPFTTLGNILTGNGLPSKLRVSLTEPQIFPQSVQNMKLGTKLGKVMGEYTFYAPLGLQK